MKKQKFTGTDIELFTTHVARPYALNIRLTKAEREVIEAAAKKFNISISDLVRSVLTQTLEHMLHSTE